MQGARFGHEALALFQEVGDILATIGAEGVRVIERATDGIGAVNFSQGHDFLHVMTQVEPAFGQLVMIGLRMGREPEEGEEEPLVTGFAALVQERLHVVGLLDVLPFLVAADMFGDQVVPGQQS